MFVEKRLINVNYTIGRGGHKPEAIVIHLMDGTLLGTDSWFRNPKAQASTHYGVGLDGRTFQWVEEKNMAWGNGRVDRPTWKGIKPGVNPNLYTISIEHEGVTGHQWTDEQYLADVELIRDIASRWNIPVDAEHVIVHSEIYAAKPNCAGNGFNKDYLLAMLKTPEVRNALVKGDREPAIYWVDEKGIAHALPTWDFYANFFGGKWKELPQRVVDGMKKGEPFKA